MSHYMTHTLFCVLLFIKSSNGRSEGVSEVADICEKVRILKTTALQHLKMLDRGARITSLSLDGMLHVFSEVGCVNCDTVAGMPMQGLKVSHYKHVDLLLGKVEAYRTLNLEAAFFVGEVEYRDPVTFSIFSVLINTLGSMAKAWNYEGECVPTPAAPAPA